MRTMQSIKYKLRRLFLADLYLDPFSLITVRNCKKISSARYLIDQNQQTLTSISFLDGNRFLINFLHINDFFVDYELSIHKHDHQSKYYLYLLQIRYIVLDDDSNDAVTLGNSLQGRTTCVQGASLSLGVLNGIDQMIADSSSATYMFTQLII